MNENEAREFNRSLIEDFRANGGIVTSGHYVDRPVLLITVRGAKTGIYRTIPLSYTEFEGRIIVVASKGGANSHPSWYYNLREHLIVTVELKNRQFKAFATLIEGNEREALFRHHSRLLPQFMRYQERTSRILPVFTLEEIN